MFAAIAPLMFGRLSNPTGGKLWKGLPHNMEALYVIYRTVTVVLLIMIIYAVAIA